MAKQYWVGEFFVDLSRNQISRQGHVQSMQPKALLVLTYLAENNCRVVSYDELLNAVWPNSIVTPNTLQRCIAQLRKALGETSKAQAIVKTHSKQGYSLECEVTWQDVGTSTAGDSNDTSDTEHSAPSPVKQPVHSLIPFKNKLHWIAASILVLMAVIFLPGYQSPSPRFEFKDLRYITATDNKEYGARYSEDGKFILFHRYYDPTCINHLWAKNSQTYEEIQLTKEKGTYNSYSLSPDGKSLAFIQQQDCTKPVSQLNCFTLKSLNFERALSQPQEGEVLLHCENSAIQSPVWVDNEHIAMMQNINQRWRIILYSANNKTSKTLYSVEDGNITHFAFSSERGEFAVVSYNSDGHKRLEMVSADGELLSSVQIRVPTGAPRHLRVRPEFIPNSDTLIFGSYGQLFTLSKSGEIQNMNFPFDRNVGAPSFHPESDRMLLISGRYDSDVAIVRIPHLPDEPGDLQSSDISFDTFERSTQSEYLAKYQPKGSAIAMASERTGTEQVWVFEEGKGKPISQFKKGTYIKSLHWSADGNSVLALASNELYHLTPDQSPVAINFSHPVDNLFYWNSDQDVVVANISVSGHQKFVEIDLDTLQYRVINDKSIKWAAKSDSDTLVFQDDMNRIWQSGAVEDMLIEPLQQQVSSKRFLFKNERLYGINNSNQLWSYEINTGELKLLANINRDFEYLSDLRGEELLVTFLVSEKKEVLEVDVDRQ